MPCDPTPQLSAGALQFLLPGITHQFGNLLLTIQANALQLTLGDAEPRQRTILSATQRGGETLHWLRTLCGEPAAGAHAAAPLLSWLGDIARVGARQRQLRIDCGEAAPTPESPQVDAALFLTASAEGLAGLAALQPAGAAGTLRTALTTPPDGGIEVDYVLLPSGDSLPFPIDVTDLTAALAATPAAPPTFRVTAMANGLRLRFPRVGAFIEPATLR